MRPVRSALILSILVLGIGILVFWNTESDFMNWKALTKSPEGVSERDISSLLLRDDILVICQLSQYTSMLNDEHASFEDVLKNADLLPVSEGGYLFAYFAKNGGLIGSEVIPANMDSLRANRAHARVGFVCVPALDGRIIVSKSGEVTKFRIK